jgi:hypothetical protein
MSVATCTCRIHWHQLYTVIEGEQYDVEPTAADTPTSVLFRAWCSGCGAAYTYPFRLSTVQSRAA